MAPSTYAPGGPPAMPGGPGGRYLPPLLDPPSTRRTSGEGFSMEFWLLLVGVALFLVAIFAVYKFHVKREKSRSESEEIVLNATNLGSTRLSRLLKYMWARLVIAFLDWHVFICRLLLGI